MVRVGFLEDVQLEVTHCVGQKEKESGGLSGRTTRAQRTRLWVNWNDDWHDAVASLAN